MLLPPLLIVVANGFTYLRFLGGRGEPRRSGSLKELKSVSSRDLFDVAPLTDVNILRKPHLGDLSGGVRATSSAELVRPWEVKRGLPGGFNDV